jgi:hypothetical protein
MASNNHRVSITAIHNDITFSKRDVYLWVKAGPKHYEFEEDRVREEFVTEFSSALANILNSEESELDCELIVTSKVFDSKEWRANLLKRSSRDSPQEYFEEFTGLMSEHVESYQFREKSVYIGVNLGYRTDFSPKKSSLKLKFLDEMLTRLSGEVDEYVSEKELDFWEERARLIRYSLIESKIKATPVQAVEIAYIIRKNMFPGMKAPTIEDLSIAAPQTWGAGELETLSDGEIINTAKWLEIKQIVNGETLTGYRATLCFAKFPDSLRYPEKEPWIHSAALLGFPVDMYSRFSVIPSNKVKKQVTNKIKAIQDQAQNMTSAGGEATLEVKENYEIGRYLEHALDKDDTPWLYGRHRVVVEASSEQELKERCQLIIDHYKNMGILVVWSTGDQLSLFLEGMPNDRVRMQSYYQRHELNIMGAGVPAATGGAGDSVLVEPDGREKGWLGPYIGYTTSRVVEPVFLSIHSAIAKDNPPGLIITGSPGSGKSFTAFTITYNMALSGVQTIYIDPKMDALPLKTLPGCEDAMIVDLREGHDGLLDPFQLGENVGEVLDLVTSTIDLLVGGTNTLSSIAQSELSKSITSTIKNRFPTMNKLTEVLLNSKEPDAAALGEKLNIFRRLPFARLCFSDARKGQDVPHLTLDRKLTIITLYGLEMPTAETPKSSYTQRNQLAVSILFLLTSFTRRLMTSTTTTGEKNLPKAIVIDEAWAVTSTPQGAKLILEVARMGRSLNTAIALVSQNAGDFTGEGVTSSVSTKMAFRTKDTQEIKNVLNFFGLPNEQKNQDVVRNLRRGECLLQDADGRIARVLIDGWNEEMKHAFDTNPVSKRLNEEENTIAAL